MKTAGRIQNYVLILTVMFVGILSGCNGKYVTVSGHASYDGETIEKGVITFSMNGMGGESFSTPIENGEYSARVIPGEAIVRIFGFKTTLADKEIEAVPGSGSGIMVRPTIKNQYIPAPYNHQSNIKVMISSSERKHDFDLEAMDASPDPPFLANPKKK